MKQFLPFLTDDQGRSLSVENEVVISSSIPDPLDNSPQGWEANTLQWARNKDFWGIIKSYTTSLKFYKDGAKILRNAFYRLGMETVLFFIWLKQNVTFGAGMVYESWYKGEPDFSTFNDEWDGVEISVVEGGFFKDLQANKGLTYEVPFTDSPLVYMDGMNIYNNLSYADVNGLNIEANVYGRHFFGACVFLSNDGTSPGIFYQDETIEKESDDFATRMASTNVLITNTLPNAIIVRFTGTIEITITAIWPFGAGIQFAFTPSDTDSLNEFSNSILHLPSLGVGDIGKTFTATFDKSIYLSAGASIFRNAQFNSASDHNTIFNFTANSVFTVGLVTRQTPNIVNIWRAFDYGNKLCAAMSQGAALQSPLLENDYNLMVTSGDALRNIPGAVLKGTFSDYFKSIDAVKCSALDIINNIPVLSSRYDMFNKSSIIADLGPSSNWTLEAAADYIYDSVESGYPSKSAQADNDVNGKYSFNNTYEWKVSVTRPVVNKYECVAAYYADPYDIELLRIQFLDQDTTTANTDNSIFFLDCEPKTDLLFTGSVIYNATDNTIELTGDTSAFKLFFAVGIILRLHTGIMPLPDSYVDYTVTEILSISDTSILFKVSEYITLSATTTGTVLWMNLYQLRRKAYTTINGIINDGTVFNLELTPRRCLQNHLRWIRSSCDHLDMQYLNFLSTDKNANLQTIDADGNTITENANIQIGSMGEKVFLPYLAKFDVKSPQNLLELMNTDHTGVFDYTMNGISLDGFPVQIATNDATLESQEYQLLCSANNDLSQLINNR